MKKLATTDLDAIVLASAGLKRLGLADRISVHLDPSVMLPAVGQGALCIEHRHQDPRITPLINQLNHPDSRTAVTAERAFLQRLEGGCQVPMAAYAQIDGSRLSITGLVAEIDGRRLLKATITGWSSQARKIGRELAEALLAQGADTILEKFKFHVP